MVSLRSISPLFLFALLNSVSGLVSFYDKATNQIINVDMAPQDVSPHHTYSLALADEKGNLYSLQQHDVLVPYGQVGQDRATAQMPAQTQEAASQQQQQFTVNQFGNGFGAGLGGLGGGFGPGLGGKGKTTIGLALGGGGGFGGGHGGPGGPGGKKGGGGGGIPIVVVGKPYALPYPVGAGAGGIGLDGAGLAGAGLYGGGLGGFGGGLGGGHFGHF